MSEMARPKLPQPVLDPQTTPIATNNAQIEYHQNYTEKEKLFVKYYLMYLNATKAARKANLGPNCPSEIGYEYLRKPQIQSLIKQEMQRRADALQVDQYRVLEEIMNIALSDPGDCFDADTGAMLPIHHLPEYARRALSGVDVTQQSNRDGEVTTTFKYRFWNKTEANKLMAQHLGMIGSDAGAVIQDFQAALMDTLAELTPEARNAFIEKLRSRRAAR